MPHLPAPEAPRAAASEPLPPPPDPALRAAIVASLEPSAAVAAGLSSTALEPIAPLVRDGEEPVARVEATQPEQRVPPETIQRTVRQSRGRFRECYQQALLRDAAAEGRVVVHFVIGTDGKVSRAEEESATLPDRPARECVLSRFFELAFTNPSGRRIDVRYPLRFSPDGAATSDELPSARRVAERPPPGFAEAMRSGRRVQPTPKGSPPIMVRVPAKSTCVAGDPMCSDL